MKTPGIFLFILLCACHTPAPISTTKADSTATAKSGAIQKIIFNTGSRGYRKNIVITKDSVVLVINSSFEGNPSKNIRTRSSETEWNKVNNALNGVDVTKLNELESPTMKRAVDAANHSNITITTDKEYNHDFDDYNPHEQLKKLMGVIQEIEKDRNK